MAEDLKAWLESVSEDCNTDLTGHLDDLTKHGISKFLLNDIAPEDWCEIIKPVGPRILLRNAAGNVYVKAELKNLMGFSVRLKEQRDEAVTEGQNIRAELERSQMELSRIDNDLSKTESEVSAAAKLTEEANKAIETLQADKEKYEKKIADTREKIEKANAEKEKALKDKEEAINRAIQFGISSGGPGTTNGPPGYTFQGGLPPSASVAPPPGQPIPQQTPMQQQPPQQQQMQYAQQQQAPQQQQMQMPPQQQMQMPPQQQMQMPPQQQMQQRPQGGASLESQPYYHASISRPACESLLMSCPQDSFLIRLSTRGEQSYSLSAREIGKPNVKHFKIEKRGQQWVLGLKQPDGKAFPTIVALVAHYQSVGPFSGVALKNPAPKQNAQTFQAPRGQY